MPLIPGHDQASQTFCLPPQPPTHNFIYILSIHGIPCAWAEHQGW